MLEEARSDKTRAVMFAHTLGNPFDLAAVKAFCDKHDLWLIEDCCDALGATYDGKPVGTFGNIADGEKLASRTSDPARIVEQDDLVTADRTTTKY